MPNGNANRSDIKICQAPESVIERAEESRFTMGVLQQNGAQRRGERQRHYARNRTRHRYRYRKLTV